MAIFGLVNVVRISSKDLGLSRLLKLKSNVLRKLTTDRNNNSASSLQLVDIHDTLVAKLLEVQLVGNVEVGLNTC